MVEPTEQTIYNWWNRHVVDTGRRAGTPTIENSELFATRPPDRRAREGTRRDAPSQRAAEVVVVVVVPPRASSRPFR